MDVAECGRRANFVKNVKVAPLSNLICVSSRQVHLKYLRVGQRHDQSHRVDLQTQHGQQDPQQHARETKLRDSGRVGTG